jgi:hypothetical protein
VADQFTMESLRAYKQAHPPVPCEQWDSDGCVSLAIAIIEEAKEAYIHAYVSLRQYDEHVARCPTAASAKTEADLINNLKMAREFFQSHYFQILSMGQTNAKDVLKYLNSIAERKFKYGNPGSKGRASQAVVREPERAL